uniref:Branched-chain amino acid transport system ATP-binding protein n=1 Tax=Candidatus Kentrum sp. MB TaxID=2138164 RepID=A0A451B9G9_9GAMM|nr:MAG: branched-chain amino acid transport system ATP-binding protein [Candidatus Kentron sp. MB]VFK27025.1 MAG: branched-chain amino acid transport system ATP-binding protein [Candidatus Kentron sp. MB]VFK74936.1 MAG: branched-chain amino acid transport system ATP-binding protein [Candidatus Kentron sp. MB]
MQMSSPVLAIQDINKRFGHVAVLRGVNAALPAGMVTAFVGPNGAGKTTLFHTITGDLVPDSGTVMLHDNPITGLKPWKVARKGIGKMFQDVRIFDNLTIIENVLLALHDHRDQSVWMSLMTAASRKKRELALREEAESWLERAGVEPPYDRPAELLSFGNKKLLALARLMAGGFDVLLLDEPTAGVSPTMINRIAELIEYLIHRGITIALIEHNFSFVTDVAEQTYLLREGRIHDHGPTMDVLSKEENREVLIGL